MWVIVMIQSISRAARILRLTAESGDGIRLCDLARACGLKRNTAFNLADSLVNERLLEKTSDGKYVIGELAGELADGRSRAGYLRGVEAELRELRRKYPDAYIYYSELGNADIIVKMYAHPDKPGRVFYPDGMTLNPYLTVAGLAFFAFTPDERLTGLKHKNPFETQGLNAWGSFADFEEGLMRYRKSGYSEPPPSMARPFLKIGVPVRGQDGGMAGAVTFDLKERGDLSVSEVLEDVLSLVGVAS